MLYRILLKAQKSSLRCYVKSLLKSPFITNKSIQTFKEQYYKYACPSKLLKNYGWTKTCTYLGLRYPRPVDPPLFPAQRRHLHRILLLHRRRLGTKRFSPLGAHRQGTPQPRGNPLARHSLGGVGNRPRNSRTIFQAVPFARGTMSIARFGTMSVT